MSNKLNLWNQTQEWEGDCIKTRRGISLRLRRLNFFGFNKNELILDLGCGDGLNIKILRQKGIKNVVGIDISKELLKEAKKLNPKNKFYLASAESLPFKSDNFDVVLVDSVFHHFMRFEKSLKEIKRVLKPGGRLCFVEPHKSIFRTMYDYFSVSPLAKYTPFFKERGPAYLAEIKFMKHWLETEADFFALLDILKFNELQKKADILSIIGIYEKPRL